jgi:L-seryl-tRNA(Ser) seleniumtransferase
MRVHASNFRIIGFTETAGLADMAGLAHDRGLLLIDDLGSGCLLDTRAYGLMSEPAPRESLAAGADLVLFSGDKLLGGPQAGIIAGRRDLVERLKRHPLARALRMDKASIAALNATLLHYVKGEAEREVPVWRMISAPVQELDRRARQWARELGAPGRHAGSRPSRAVGRTDPGAPRPVSNELYTASIVDGRSMIGGGSLPEESLATRLLAIECEDVDGLAKRLRLGDPAVVGRVERGRLLLDPRTVRSSDTPALVRALKAALAG